ncbi:MAG TPA: biotin/lipoyl-containing protein, partial [Gaiellaceae bacterium]|nr:biotin/lipoyl-containing protein [Gaiellaceae bacterium]
MAYEFKLPDLGEGLTEGEIARWLVAEGQEIAEDDPLVEIQTDKTTVEIPSPAAGVVSRIFVGEGEVVPVGTVLVVIGGDGAEPAAAEQPRAAPSPPQATPEARPARKGPARATPLVRRIAQELGVDLETVGGTGPGGRIT